jgi:hypothetical protein
MPSDKLLEPLHGKMCFVVRLYEQLVTAWGHYQHLFEFNLDAEIDWDCSHKPAFAFDCNASRLYGICRSLCVDAEAFM